MEPMQLVTVILFYYRIPIPYIQLFFINNISPIILSSFHLETNWYQLSISFGFFFVLINLEIKCEVLLAIDFNIFCEFSSV